MDESHVSINPILVNNKKSNTNDGTGNKKQVSESFHLQSQATQATTNVVTGNAQSSSILTHIWGIPVAVRKLQEISEWFELYEVICHETVKLINRPNGRGQALLFEEKKKNPMLSTLDVFYIRIVCDMVYCLLSLSSTLVVTFGCFDADVLGLLKVATYFGNFGVLASSLITLGLRRRLIGRFVGFLISFFTVFLIAFLFFVSVPIGSVPIGCCIGLALYFFWHGIPIFDIMRYGSYIHNFHEGDGTRHLHRLDRFIAIVCLKCCMYCVVSVKQLLLRCSRPAVS